MNSFNNYDKSSDVSSILASIRTRPNGRRWLFRPFMALAISWSVNVYAAPPVAVDDTRTISVNSSLTLNPLANDYDPDGDSLVIISIGTPTNGTATLNADGSVYYVPDRGFVGIDTFPYTIQEETEEALTDTATITVNVTEDGLRSRAENDNTRNLAQVIESVCNRLRETSESEQGAARRDLLARCNALEAMEDSSMLNSALRQIAPEETIAQMRVAADSSRAQSGVVSQRLQQLQTGNSAFSVNGIALGEALGLGTAGGGASADDSIWARVGVFANIQIDSAERKTTSLENGYDYDASTLTLGADYRLDANMVVGGALGFTWNELDYAQQGGKLETDIITLIVFGSHQFDSYSLDAQLGYSTIDFESWRYINYNEGSETLDETLRGWTNGSQWLFNTQVQWEWHRDALTLYPYGRVDYVRNSTKGYGEQGDSGWAMMFSGQSMSQLTLSAGVQATYAISRSWGVLIPTAELSLLSDVNANYNPVTARFAYDPEQNNAFTLQSDGGQSSYFHVAIGASALFTHGLSGYLRYQQLVGYDNLSAYQIQAGIRYEL